MKSIATQIKARMLQQGISAHALEKRAGLKPSAVHNILYGRSKNPGITIIQAIAHALECKVSDLIDEIPSSQKVDIKSSEKVDTKSSEKVLVPLWESELYFESFEMVNSLLKSKKILLSKEKVLAIVDEVYLYAQKGKKQTPDCLFAEWIIEKHVM